MQRNASTPAMRTLEYAPSCRLLSMILLGVYLASFSVSWYRVWWDSIIGLAVAAAGFYVLFNTNAEPKELHVRYVYYGHIVSMTSHIIALGVASYAVIEVSLLDTITSSSDNPGTALFVCLFLFLLAEMGITGFTIERMHNLSSELSRNEYFARGSAAV